MRVYRASLFCASVLKEAPRKTGRKVGGLMGWGCGVGEDDGGGGWPRESQDGAAID